MPIFTVDDERVNDTIRRACVGNKKVLNALRPRDCKIECVAHILGEDDVKVIILDTFALRVGLLQLTEPSRFRTILSHLNDDLLFKMAGILLGHSEPLQSIDLLTYVEWWAGLSHV